MLDLLVMRINRIPRRETGSLHRGGQIRIIATQAENAGPWRPDFSEPIYAHVEYIVPKEAIMPIGDDQIDLGHSPVAQIM